MAELPCWLLYGDQDYLQNQDFAALFAREGTKRGLVIEPVLLSQLTLSMEEDGTPSLLYKGKPARPGLVLSRQRHSLISRHLEAMGIPVYNNSIVCGLCNHKAKTLRFLQGLPMVESQFPSPSSPPPPAEAYPLVVKPARGHGGDRVFLLRSQEDWQQAASAIQPDDIIQQRPVSNMGQDLRVYVVFGDIVAAVMRRSTGDFRSNAGLGGVPSLHILAPEERSLAQEVAKRFAQAGAELALAGIDFLYQNNHPLISEVEDVVGSRMLYQVSNINIVGVFLDRLVARL